MIIRAKDQASRVINSVANSAIGDFTRVQREAVTKSRQLSIQMADMRTKYDRAILQSRERLFAAERAGDTAAAAAARERIKRLQLIQAAQTLNIRQAQILHRQQQLEIRQQMAAKQAMIEHNRMLARTAGVWVATGAAMALVGGTAIRALHGMAMGAVEYQRQAALTLTQVREQGKGVKELQAISNNVAASIGVPFERLQTSLYDIFSSTDIRVKQSQGVLAQFAKAAVAGQVDIQQAGRATIAFMNAFKVPVSGISRLLDIQFEAVRLGTMTYAEFSSQVGKAIPAVRASGQSIEFLAGTMAFLTRNGQSAAQASIAIARGSELFLRKPVQAYLRSMGIEALTASGRLRPINELMTELAPHFANLDDVQKKRLFEKIFGGQSTIQARRFFELAIRDSKGLNRFIREVTDSSGAFAEAYGTMSQTIAVRTERMKNQWRIFKNTLGEDVSPALGTIIDKTTELLSVLNRMEPGQRKVLAGTAAWGAAALTAVGSIIALTGALKLLRVGLRMAALESVAAARALGVVGTAATSTAGSIGILLAAITLGTVYLAKNINNTEKAAEAQEKYALGLGRGIKGTQLAAEHTRELTDNIGKNYAAMTAGQKAAELWGEKGMLAVETHAGKATAAVIAQNKALGSNKEKIFDVTKAIQKTFPTYDHLAAKADLTTREITKDFEKQAKYFRDWATNVQELIRRGVDPKFVRDLSKRGPEFVAAYAQGTTKEVQRGERAWREAHAAMASASKTNFDKAGAAARDGHRQTKDAVGKTKTEFSSLAAHANRNLKNIADERVGITAVFGYKTPPKLSIHQIVGARGGYVTASGIVRRMSDGGPVWGAGTSTSDSIPARLSNGEFVVNSRATSRHRELLEAINSHGYASGGIVTDLKRNNFNAVQPGINAFLRNIHSTLQQVAGMFQSAVNQTGKQLLTTFTMPGGVGGPLRGGATQNRAIVHSIFASMFGWGGPQLAATDALIMRESGYNNLAQNPTSTAFGLFQFLNSTWAGTGIRKTSDPRLQAIAGGRYISGRYGSPAGAWRFWQAHHWYHGGGPVNEDIVGVGRSGRTYGFQRGETVVARGDGTKSITNNFNIVTNEIEPQRNAQLLGWELARRL